MSFSGLCVGGPADGKKIQQAKPTFRATSREPIGMVEGTQEPMFETTDYKWIRLNKAVQLWLPQGVTIDDAMLLLATHYKPETADVE